MTLESKESTDVARSPWAAALIIVLGAFMAMLASTSVTVAVPDLAQRFEVRYEDAQWLATAYLLALAAGIPVSGWVSRRLGATRLWLVCLAMFAAFSVACALSSTFPMLLCGRIFQGLTGGVLVTAGQVILGVVAGRARLGRVMSTTGIAVVVAPTLGTTVGAVLLAHADWRWLFWLNLPLSAVAIVAGVLALPRTNLGSAGHLDWIGVILGVGGLSAAVYGTSSIAAAGEFGDVAADAFVVAGILALIGFVVWSLRSANPLLNLRLFKNEVFAAGVVVMAVGGAVNFAAQVVLPLYFVSARDQDVMAAGLLVAPQIIGTAIGFPIAGRLADRSGAGPMLIIGSVITALATVPLALADGGTSFWWLGFVLFIRGLGVALSTIPALTVSLAAVQADQLADATPILNVAQRIGASAGTAVAALVYSAHLAGTDPKDAASVAFTVVSWWLFTGACLLAGFAFLVARTESRQDC
ncbi:DHA2 family efflux MFS transporter permease subunit [Mycolicibacterium nivoides]|uniref:DHA2 family efflux MFS transporter permease subunit n=1 Tax=Mycolicibacterium nivoides TaxID=2487344 RepID=A0ABW9LGS4_9MYCO